MSFQAVQDARSAVDDRQNKGDQDDQMSSIQFDEWAEGGKQAMVGCVALTGSG